MTKIDQEDKAGSAARKLSDLLTECAECGGYRLAPGRHMDSEALRNAQKRYDELMRIINEGDDWSIAAEALKPVIIACEATDDRKTLAEALNAVVDAFEDVNKLPPSNPPEALGPGVWDALERDLNEMKRKGVPDDDPRITSRLEALRLAWSVAVKLVPEYRLRPTSG